MAELDKVAVALFDKIRSRFDAVTLGDAAAKATNDPAQARFFNFDYVSRDGENFGNITISLVNNDSLKIYFGKNITEPLTDKQQEEWFDFLRSLRHFARRNMLTFDTRDITRNALDLQAIRQTAKADRSYTADEVATVIESQLFGSTRTSYQPIDSAKLIVRHSQKVNEEQRGARTRKIESIFVETAEGERFKLPFNNLHGARAMARHIAQGGTVLDEAAAHIVETVKELSAMSQFVRAMNYRVFEDSETLTMVEAAKARYNHLKKNLKSWSGARGYAGYFGDFSATESTNLAEFDADSLKDRFTKKIFDDRLAEALPYVQRAYQEYNKMNETSMSQEFEHWARQMVEAIGTGTVSDQDTQQLRNLFQTELPVGADGTDAITLVNRLITDTTLHDRLYELSQIAGARADARPVIFHWIQDNRPDLANKIDYTVESAGVQPKSQANTQESSAQESIAFIRHLAGLKR